MYIYIYVCMQYEEKKGSIRAEEDSKAQVSGLKPSTLNSEP